MAFVSVLRALLASACYGSANGNTFGPEAEDLYKYAMPRKEQEHTGKPAFPYAELPSVLRRLLVEIPKRPKPARLNETTAVSWGLPKGGNTRSAILVLKRIGILSEAGEPQDSYAQFMTPGTGPASLSSRIKLIYKPLFDASHSPQTDGNDALRSLFNIHSGGSKQNIDKQIQTFKALCESADFAGGDKAQPQGGGGGDGGKPQDGNKDNLPPVKIDLHIHLPENKTTREYEAIIQDIARYIYGRKVAGDDAE